MKQLVFLGDSLTEYFDWQSLFPTHKAINLGIAGETVEELHARLGRMHESIADPDFIFIMSGINNIAMEDYEFLPIYRNVLADIGSWFKKTITVVQSVLPVILPWVEIRMIEKINVSLSEMAQEFNMEYLDIYKLFVDSRHSPVTEYLMDDGVHLSVRGYEVWAKIVEEFVGRKS